MSFNRPAVLCHWYLKQALSAAGCDESSVAAQRKYGIWIRKEIEKILSYRHDLADCLTANIR